jgi:hypothetical protein
METHSEKRQLRSFGLTTGAIFLAIGLWPLLKGHDPRWWGLALSATLLPPGLLAPGLLRKPHQLWLGIADVLGWVNTRVIFALMFYLVFTPVGFLMHLAGFDPMNRSFLASARTYRVLRQSRPSSHLKHHF